MVDHDEDGGAPGDVVYRLSKNQPSSKGWGFSNNTYGRAYHDDRDCHQIPRDKTPRATTRRQAQRHMFPCSHCVTETVDTSPNNEKDCPVCGEPIDGHLPPHIEREHH